MCATFDKLEVRQGGVCRASGYAPGGGSVPGGERSFAAREESASPQWRLPRVGGGGSGGPPPPHPQPWLGGHLVRGWGLSDGKSPSASSGRWFRPEAQLLALVRLSATLDALVRARIRAKERWVPETRRQISRNPAPFFFFFLPWIRAGAERGTWHCLKAGQSWVVTGWVKDKHGGSSHSQGGTGASVCALCGMDPRDTLEWKGGFPVRIAGRVQDGASGRA